jgi:hypothetical protein
MRDWRDSPIATIVFFSIVVGAWFLSNVWWPRGSIVSVAIAVIAVPLLIWLGLPSIKRLLDG